MNKQSIDFLLVGQGLAGSVLSDHLRERGCSVRVINSTQHCASASRAAAGLYNPITGRKMTKTWRADELFPYLETFYPALEQRLGGSFFHPIPIYRPFGGANERNDWAVQADNIHFAPYVQEVTSGHAYRAYVHDPLGGLLLRRCGYLDVPALLLAYRTYLLGQGLYEEAVFDPEQLTIEQAYVTYQRWRARKLIFCDGASGAQNPFFGWLPFRPVKGEMLLIKPQREIPVVVNRGIFVIPQGTDATCKVGATYDHHDLSDTPTRGGRQTLTQKLNQLLTIPYNIVDQWAGVRPATQDRLPMIGNHPVHEPLAIFNGFGTKGVSLAPYFAQHFVHCLAENQPVDEAVNVRRFYRTYHALHSL